jgi:hypothetical protein
MAKILTKCLMACNQNRGSDPFWHHRYHLKILDRPVRVAHYGPEGLLITINEALETSPYAHHQTIAAPVELVGGDAVARKRNPPTQENWLVMY